MRLNGQNGDARVRADADSIRPVKINIGRLSFSCTVDEAIALARDLVAAVDEIRGGVRSDG